jgi:hypothetical protein
MGKWMTGFSRAALMGLAWAVVWVPAGALVGTRIVGELEPEHIGGPLYAAFLCGALFSAVAGIAGGRHRLEEVAYSRAAAWGALSGLLTGAFPFVLGDQHGNPTPVWLLPVALMASMALASAVSAIGSAWVGRIAKKGNWFDAVTGAA